MLQVRLISDKETNKPTGYAFIEYVHTRDMKGTAVCAVSFWDFLTLLPILYVKLNLASMFFYMQN